MIVNWENVLQPNGTVGLPAKAIQYDYNAPSFGANAAVGCVPCAMAGLGGVQETWSDAIQFMQSYVMSIPGIGAPMYVASLVYDYATASQQDLNAFQSHVDRALLNGEIDASQYAAIVNAKKALIEAASKGSLGPNLQTWADGLKGLGDAFKSFVEGFAILVGLGIGGYLLWPVIASKRGGK